MKKYLTALSLLLAATSLWSQNYLFDFDLRTQHRRYTVHFEQRGDTLALCWSIPRHGKIQQGEYQMLPQHLEHATKLCYLAPADRQYVLIPEEELFCLLSRDALRAIREQGQCRFNNTQLRLVERVPDNIPDQPGATLLHLRDDDEGYDLWVRDDLELPMIVRMKNNPVEADWIVKDLPPAPPSKGGE